MFPAVFILFLDYIINKTKFVVCRCIKTPLNPFLKILSCIISISVFLHYKHFPTLKYKNFPAMQ